MIIHFVTVSHIYTCTCVDLSISVNLYSLLGELFRAGKSLVIDREKCARMLPGSHGFLFLSLNYVALGIPKSNDFVVVL